MRALLLALALLLLAPDALASGSVWEQRRVPVYDHTGPAYAGAVQRAVAHLNAAIPKRGPTLRYKRKPFRPCPAKWREGAVVVCEMPRSNGGGLALTRADRHVMRWAMVRLTHGADLVGHGGTQDGDLLAEEELIHAVLDRGDGAAHADWPDVARYAKKTYRKHRRH